MYHGQLGFVVKAGVRSLAEMAEYGYICGAG
jgi:hypothetical protein